MGGTGTAMLSWTKADSANVPMLTAFCMGTNLCAANNSGVLRHLHRDYTEHSLLLLPQWYHQMLAHHLGDICRSDVCQQ